jgi:hypothetical protein
MIFSHRSQFAAQCSPSMTEKPRLRHARAFMLLAICIGSGFAQTRKGPAPQAPLDVLRAVSVYEWTGDLAKPAAARVVPVSLFIDHQFEDAGLYLSRPMPLALEPGNIYELELAGVDQGAVTLTQASRLHSTNAVTSFDEGWFGYGTWKPLAVPKPFVPNSTASDAHVVTSGEGAPHFNRQASAAPSAAPPATSSPTTKQSTPSDAPPTDPDRPTLHHTAPGDAQRSDSQNSGSQGSQTTSTQTASATPPAATTSSAPAASAPAPASSPAPSPNQSKTNDAPDNTPAGDPDRPTFSRHGPANGPTNQRKSSRNDSASVTAAGGLLADDPGRPHLHHGVASKDAAPAALHGLPPDMHQRVLVSDAADRPEHDFAYPWTDAHEKAATMTKLEAMARSALAPEPAAHPVHAAAARRRKAPATIELLEEELHAYEISYGGVDVFVFSARTEDQRYVTLIAQPDIYGAPHVLLQSVSGATHLDETPRMLFLDAVDADGDNRAELLFELRGETQRQFALYRIAQGTAEQTFLGGTPQ